MTGALLNVAGILLGGFIGLARRKSLSQGNEAFFKLALGAFTVFYGLRLTWLSLNGTFGRILRQLLVVIVALMLGKIFGKLLRLQKLSNRVGQNARARLANARPYASDRLNVGFQTCSALFCAAPLAFLGSAQDGLSDYFYPLVIKAVIDGLATMGFVLLFGWGVILAALPVFVLEGSITLACAHFLKPVLEARGLIDPVNAVGGLLVFCVGLLILDLKKIEVTDYLPSLVIAPLLASLFHVVG